MNAAVEQVDVDVVIVGGGPAGLSAALVLGRACKRVLVCDAGAPRNASAQHMHGYLTRDGVPPPEFRRTAREELRPYDVSFRSVRVKDISRLEDGHFLVSFEDGAVATCRRVLLALGMVDEVPEIGGIRDHWGRSVFLCPYCHGWEVRGRRWGMLGTEPAHLEFAAFLTGWTSDVVVFWQGSGEIPPDRLEQLKAHGVKVERRRVVRVLSGPGDAAGGEMEAVALEDGSVVSRDVLVVRPRQQQTALVRRLGLALDDRGYVRVGPNEETSLPGIFAAGDCTSAVQGAQLSAAAGTRAAYAVNLSLNLSRPSPGGRHG